MSDDNFSEASNESWFGRIGGAFKGIVVGLILFALSFPLLFWNEGRAVKTYKTLAEAGKSVIPVASDKVDPANAGKLIYLAGRAVTEASVTDPVFGVSAKALRLERAVEMYQWEEKKTSKTEKKLGGGSETVTTYSYSKAWANKLIPSSVFKRDAEHQNPADMPFKPENFVADPVYLGAFSLSRPLVLQIDSFSPLSLGDKAAVPDALKGKAKRTPTGFYIGSNPASPQIGDVRVSFNEVNPAEVSVIAAQVGSGLGAYQTKAGGTVEILRVGLKPADAMIKSAQDSNTMMTWLLRLVGFILMFSGLALIL